MTTPAPNVCPACNETRSLNGACSCDADGVPPAAWCPWPRSRRLGIRGTTSTGTSTRPVLQRHEPVIGPQRRRAALRRAGHPEDASGCVCGRPTRDDAYVCDDCLDDLARDLRRIPDVVIDLNVARAGIRGIDYTALISGSGGTKEIEWPISVQAVHARSRLKDTLWRLVVTCLQLDLPHSSPTAVVPHRGDVPAMASWLLWRVDAMPTKPHFATAPADVHRAVERGVIVAMPTPLRQRLGACPMPDCDGTVSTEPGSVWAACDVCGTAVDADARRSQALTDMDDEELTAAEIARVATYVGLRSNDDGTALLAEGRDREAVRLRLVDWHRRGRIHRTNDPTATVPTFRFGTVYALLVQHQAKHRHAWTPWTPDATTDTDPAGEHVRLARTCRDCPESQTKPNPRHERRRR